MKVWDATNLLAYKSSTIVCAVPYSQWTEKGDKAFYDLVVISYTAKNTKDYKRNLGVNQFTVRKIWDLGVGGWRRIWKIVRTLVKILATLLWHETDMH